MPGYITIAVIIPLVITAFIMGNYTLYERTLVKHSWPWQFLVVTVVFLVQEYVITFMSYQLTDYCFYQYVIAILMYNLLNTGVYGAYMACLTPFVVNSCLVLMGSRPVIYQRQGRVLPRGGRSAQDLPTDLCRPALLYSPGRTAAVDFFGGDHLLASR